MALAPAGSSTYSSDTMNVGDGTWDSSKNTFLLPNLQGLNFATMRYNGMGNRFSAEPQYHVLVKGHGIIATITFLFVVPAAILIARYYRRSGVWALRLHIWLQVVTVALTTVVFILGFLAVGPDRSLTNPHHGIGLAIYVLVLFQAIYGWWMHGREKGRMRIRLPMKLVIHQWLGRAIALLGLAQIPLGLTLYGSPESLFILYALGAFALLFIFFVLSYRHDTWIDGGGGGGRIPGVDGNASYVSRTEYTEDDRMSNRRRSGSGLTAPLAGAATAAAAMIGMDRFRNRNRSRDRSRSRRRPEVIPSRAGSEPTGTGSFTEEEKYSEYDDRRRGGGWGRRIMEGVGLAGGLAAAREIFSGRRRDERDVQRNQYSYGPPPPLGGATEISQTQTDLSRAEEGRSSSRPYQSNLRRRSHSPVTADYNQTETDLTRQDHHDALERGVIGGIGALGLLGYMRARRERNAERREQRRLDELRAHEVEQERISRANSRRYTGDGFPRRGGRRNSLTTSTDTGLTPTPAGRGPPGHHHGVPPMPGAPIPGPPGRTPGPTPGPSASDIPPVAPVPMPDPAFYHRHEDSDSEAYPSPSGREHHRAGSIAPAAAAGAAGAAAGFAAEEAASRRRRDHSTGSISSPASNPVSVKVQMHNHGRHVTLRRLTEEEAAAEREARRRERRNRDDQVAASEFSGPEGDSWRRVEDRERLQAEQARREREAEQRAEAAVSTPAPSIPPSLQAGQQPPVGQPGPSNSAPPGAYGYPGYSQPTGSVVSPGTITGTEASGHTDFDSSRRRRRAERAQAKLDAERRRQGGGSGGPSGSRVEFT